MKKKLLFLLCICTSLMNSFGQINFNVSYNSYSTGSVPRSVFSADFNNDGNKDLVTGNQGSDNVSVLLGSNSGTFSAATNYSVGLSPYSVFSTDFNGDGKMDIVTANSGDNNVSVLLGSSSGTFAAAVNYSVGTNPYSVFSTDFNGDGKKDIVTANYNSNNISVLFGDGIGSFASAINYSVGVSPVSVCSADFNADGKMDVVTANSGGNNISLLLGSASGTFSSALSFSTNNSPVSLTSNDFNNDGVSDLAVLNLTGGNVNIFFGSNSSVFSNTSNTIFLGGPKSIISADFNGDGNVDIAHAGGTATPNMLVYAGNGNGAFVHANTTSNGCDVLALTSSDFNNDGKIDVAVTDILCASVNVLLNTSADVFASALNFDGVNDRVSINNSLTNSFTLETYIKTSTPSATGSNAWQGSGIMDSDVPGVANDFILSILNNRVAFWDGSSSVNVVSTSTVTDGAWKHVALTRAAGGQIKLYINGVLESTGTAGGASLNANPLIYFGNNFNAGTFTNISMDETRIWNRVLCQAEIQNNMNGELPPGQYGLLSYYKYNQGIAASSNATVTTLNDASGNANNGTLSNFALTGTTSNWVSPGAVTSGSNVANYASATISISGANSICSGSSTTFTASGAVSSYTWNTGSTTSTISVTPTVTTTYSVVGTNSVGCISNVATKTLTVNALPTASITGVAAICAGQTATLTATGGGTYEWSTGATTSGIITSLGGTYTATITNVAGCSKTAIRTVTVNPLPTASISGVNNICEGKSTTLTASGGGTYLWNTGANTAAITVSPVMTTPYTVTVTSVSGCTSTATRAVNVNPIPTGTITGNTSICAGQSTTLTASGGALYAWTMGANTPSIVVSPAINTSYGATVTSVAGCTVFTSKTVVVNPLPTPAISGLNTICVGQTTTLTASGGGTYLWSNGASTSTIAVSPAVSTAYTATVTSAAGCTATATRNVNVNSLPTPSISGISSICEGQSTTLIASGGGTYIWNTGANTAAISVSPTLDEVYTVTVTNASGCKATAVRVVTVNAIPTASITGNTSICAGQITTLTASGGASYVWSTGANTSSISVSPFSNATYVATVTSVAGCTTTAVQVVTVNPLPTPVISGLNNICVGEATTLTASGGGTYLWSNGANTSIIVVSPTITTAYTSTVTSVSGCTATATRNVNVYSLPTPSISGTSSICEGQSTTLTASGGAIYAWNTGANTAAISVSPTLDAAYTVTVTNASGCKATAVRVVTVNTLPVISVNSGTICSGESFTISPSGADTYTISGGSNVVSPTVDATYNVTGTDANGCVSSIAATSSVVVNVLPVISVNSGTICSGESFTISPSGADTYTISGGSNVVSPTVDATYNVTGTDANGCVSSTAATSSVVVNALPVISVNSGSICAGQSFTMVPSGAVTYTYSNGSDVVTPSVNDSYTVTGTDANGCVSATGAVSTVTVNALPVISVNSGTICSGESFTISPSGADTYTISGGSNIVSPTIDAIYNVTGTDANGCVSSTAATSSVVVNTLPVISVNSGSICAGQSFTMVPSGAVTYTYSNGSDVVTPSVNDSYIVTGTDANGCENTAISVVTVNALPNISATSNNTLLCVGETATLTATGANTYTWSTTNTGNDITVSPTVTTSYSVTGTDNNGCSNSASVTQTVSLCTGINQFVNESSISIFPNPFTDVITIKNSFENYSITIVDVLGKVVFEKTTSSKETELNLSSLNQGFYQLIVKAENNSYTQKIIKQ